MTDCEITMNDLLNAQLNARIEGIKSERARIVGIIKKEIEVFELVCEGLEELQEGSLSQAVLFELKKLKEEIESKK